VLTGTSYLTDEQYTRMQAQQQKKDVAAARKAQAVQQPQQAKQAVKQPAQQAKAVNPEIKARSEYAQKGLSLMKAWGEDRLKETPTDELGKSLVESSKAFQERFDKLDLNNADEFNEFDTDLKKEFEEAEAKADELKTVKDQDIEQSNDIQKVLDDQMSVDELGNDMAADAGLNQSQGQVVEMAPPAMVM